MLKLAQFTQVENRKNIIGAEDVRTSFFTHGIKAPSLKFQVEDWRKNVEQKLTDMSLNRSGNMCNASNHVCMEPDLLFIQLNT